MTVTIQKIGMVPKKIGLIAFVVVGGIMLATMTYLATIYGFLGLFSVALCLCILFTVVTAFISLR